MIDLYQEITDRIVAELENNCISWRKGWLGSLDCAVSHTTLKPYSLLNQILLGGKPGEWITLRQANQEGGSIRKGEKSRMVVFWKMLEEEDKRTGEKRVIPILKYYRVFHISQCEGIKPRMKTEPLPNCVQPNEEAERIFRTYVDREHIRVEQYLGAPCCYSASRDTITLPAREQFVSTGELYSAAFHEAGHSSGHASRLNRLTEDKYGSEGYSQEELVAEVTAATLVHRAGLETPESFRNSAAYIQGWLRALRSDKRLLIRAFGQAEKAVNYILWGTEKEPQHVEKGCEEI